MSESNESNILTGILYEAEAATKQALFAGAADWLIQKGAAKDKQAVIQAFYDRERIGSTMNAPGLAIPHAAGKAIEKEALLLICSRHDIIWSENHSAHTFLCLCLSENPSKESLAYIKKIILRTLDPHWDQILAKRTPDELKQFLSD